MKLAFWLSGIFLFAVGLGAIFILGKNTPIWIVLAWTLTSTFMVLKGTENWGDDS